MKECNVDPAPGTKSDTDSYNVLNKLNNLVLGQGLQRWQIETSSVWTAMVKDST